MIEVGQVYPLILVKSAGIIRYGGHLMRYHDVFSRFVSVFTCILGRFYIAQNVCIGLECLSYSQIPWEFQFFVFCKIERFDEKLKLSWDMGGR